MNVILLIAMLFIKKEITVDATYYNPVPEQTEGNHLLTASGILINEEALRKGQLRYVAVSRDLRKRYPYGSYLTVISDDPYYNGDWKVVDTMNSRFTRRIDFLQHIDNECVPPTKIKIR